MYGPISSQYKSPEPQPPDEVRQYSGKKPPKASQTQRPSLITPLARILPDRLLKNTDEQGDQPVKLKTAHTLKVAFSEFYLMLILLQKFQMLNFTGFRKILKKQDKLFQTTRGDEWR